MYRGSYFPIFIIVVTALLSIAILPVINKKKRPGEINYLSDWNEAEKQFLNNSKRQAIYTGEHLPVIETNNLGELGKLTALTFLHWVKDHPNGVIALPTGKTPELFIEYLKYYKQHWSEPQTRKDLKRYGITLASFPETKQLRFVQLDEFYPIDTSQQNSFTAYIQSYYLSLLEIPPENVLTMDLCKEGILKEKGLNEVFPNGKIDLTLTSREPHTPLEALQKQALNEAEEFCELYEEKVRAWGGIGFFLGGIGPDGHIAYNMEGSPHNTKTRLVQLNYPSAAAAASDLGGMEYSRDKTAVTIGLETITFNPDATVVIIAAGEAKAHVIADAVQKPKDPRYPASAFQDFRGARFYITKGAASLLEARRLEDLQKKRWHQFSGEEIDDVVIELALRENKRIVDLKKPDFLKYPRSAALFRKFRSNRRDLLNEVRARLIAKVESGLNLPKKATLLHTGPHHDDVMLSYHPLMRKLLTNNQNYFVYLTSGFNAVTDSYMMKALNRIPEHSIDAYGPEIFQHEYPFVLRRYINSAEMNDVKSMERTESIILLKNICRIYNIKKSSELKERVKWLKEDYFVNRHPGQKDIKEIQILKGSMRESESERMLLMAGVPLPRIAHMRASFYTGDFFNPMPSIENDAQPLLGLYKRIHPQIITAAFDPEGTGPDTHYKVLQVIAQALRMGDFNGVKVWGYRNVWHRFRLSEATLMTPISEKDMVKMNHAFLTCFSTQKTASFPTTNYDGPFSGLAEKIQREQYDQLKTLLGEAYFLHHPHSAIRKAKGFVFIKEMDLDEFFKNAQELKSRVEIHKVQT